MNDGTTLRRCASGLGSISCLVSENTHVCYSDLCNVGGRPHFNLLLLIATVLILAAAVVRNIR